MTFDPFGDFATEDYLRNFEKEKDLAPGLDGSAQDAALNQVLGNTDEPAVKAQYEAMLTKRKST